MYGNGLVRVRILFFGKARELAGGEDKFVEILTGLQYDELKSKVFNEVGLFSNNRLQSQKRNTATYIPIVKGKFTPIKKVLKSN